MAAESPFIPFFELLQDDLDDGDNHRQEHQQRRESINRRRDFASLVPFWFDEFEDFYHSDSEQTTDARLLFPHFSVLHDDAFSEVSDLVDNLAVDGVFDADSVGEGGVFHRENQVNFVRNLFQDRVEQQRVGSELVIEGMNGSDFGVVDDSNYLDLDLDLGLGLGFGLEFGDVGNSDFMVGEVEDDFIFGNLRMDGGESVRAFDIRLGSEGDGIEEDDGSDLCSEEDEFDLDNENTIDDASENLCWDSLQLEDQRESDEELEWEEVGDGGMGELERDVLAMRLDEDGDDVVESVLQLRSEEVMAERVVTGWEVLLNAENMGGVNVGQEGYFYADEYETVFGQFAENESGVMGKPPAAKSVVENLAVVVVTQVDVDNNNSLCAVCKDEMCVGEKAKTLPCSHKYHGDCIIPWLGIRNTCPVCRFELPTDDPSYESRRAQRSGGGQ
ncbi:hypothetical protein QQ045_023476 [Rhodiola kirilowii]